MKASALRRPHNTAATAGRRRVKRLCCSPPLSLCFPVLLVTLAFVNLYIGIHGTRGTPQPSSAINEKENRQIHVPENPDGRGDQGEYSYETAAPESLDSLVSIPARTPTDTACRGYDGIYHIAMGDIGGAAGTIFFQFVVGQILYAEQNNLLPWVHLNNVSHVIYDPVLHGNKTVGVHVPGVWVGRNATWVRRPGGHMKDIHPGPLADTGRVEQNDLYFSGTGVWEHYFEPVSDFVPGDKSCISSSNHKVYYVTLDLYLITPGIHGFSDWAPKCWRYKYLPDYVTEPHIPLTEWLEPQRAVANRVVNDYIQFRPALQQAAARANPDCGAQPSYPACLGLHIRQSDKAAGRRVVQTSEFLPYAAAFVHSGGQHIYLATDSHVVLQEIQTNWPPHVVRRIRTMGTDIVRSNDQTAVFEMAGISHHRTNTEVLVEILALSYCQFMVHGLSAVSESSIWINLDLHERSVNLEDPEHLSPAAFGALVQMDLRRGGEAGGEESSSSHVQLPRPLRTNPWWDEERILRQSSSPKNWPSPRSPTNTACDGFDGVLWISSVGRKASIGRAFFVSVLNQLSYAEQHNLIPWVHLREPTVDLIYDPLVHNGSTVSFEMIYGMAVTVLKDENDPNVFYPGKPAQRAETLSPRTFQVTGNGIWESYLEPVSDFVPGDVSCRGKPLIELEPDLVDPGLDAFAERAVRTWRYDDVPEKVWNPTGVDLHALLGQIREKAIAIVKRHFRFKPYIERRVAAVNPPSPKIPCLGVHIRNIDKQGKYRRKVEIERFVSYMQAFVRAGGKRIYLATDSRTVLRYILNTYQNLTDVVITQGTYVVRSSKGRRREWLPHYFGDHHRVNSEALVETLALSRCSMLVHSYSTLSEASLFLNPALHNKSVNLENPVMTLEVFESVAREVVRSSLIVNDSQQPTRTGNTGNMVGQLDNSTILWRASDRVCRSNAIVYLAQKVHSSYDRDSYATLLRSLDLLKTNYLSIGDHMDNMDLFIFHTGDFLETDLAQLERLLGPDFFGVIRLVDLSGSRYWSRPVHNANDNPKDWYAWPLFSEGYRKMMHWYAIGIWDFFGRWNIVSGCTYKYIFRLDEDSFIHSPIQYNIFDLMASRNLFYGFRMCAYEMQVARRMWTWWSRRKKDFAPYRELNLEMCGFYNNFFVADLEFFQSPNVTAFLKFIDRQGHIFRRRLGDLMIHSMTVYAFSPPERIHRFLDFTYEHSTVNKTDGCVMWGGIQAGYNDVNASLTLGAFYEDQALNRGCPIQSSFLGETDLSPTYAHRKGPPISPLSLHTITAGAVELPGKGLLSG